MSGNNGLFKEDVRQAGEYLPIFEPLRVLIKQDTGVVLPEDKCWLARKASSYYVIGFKKKRGNKYNVQEKKMYNVSFSSGKFELSKHEDSYSYKNGSANNIDLLTWKETARVKAHRVSSLESTAIANIRRALSKHINSVPILCNSTGKKSMVLSYIMDKAYEGVRNIYWSTTVTDKLNIEFAKNNDIDIFEPSVDFYEYCEENAFAPIHQIYTLTDCCKRFNWQTNIPNCLTREDYKKNYLLFTGCTPPLYRLGTPKGWDIYNPVKSWSDFDFWIFIFQRNLPINNSYRFGFFRSVECAYCSRKGKFNFFLRKRYKNIPLYKDIIPTDKWDIVLMDCFISNKLWSKINCTYKEFIDDIYYSRKCIHGDKRDEAIKEHKLCYLYDNTDKYFTEQFCSKCGRKLQIDDIILSDFLKQEQLCRICSKHKYNMRAEELDKLLIKIKAGKVNTK